MISIRHNVTEFTAIVPLTPFDGQPEDVTVRYAFYPASVARAMMNEKNAQEFCAAVIRGWADGIDTPYSPEALTELLDYNPAMALELISGYWKGLAQARAKN